MGIIKARIQNENGEYSWADIATSSQHTHKVQQLEDNSILATKADLGLQALVDENGNPITDEQGNQKYNSLAQIFHDWLSDIKKDQPDWKETNTASPNYIQNKPTTIIETINNMPPDEEGNVKVDTLPAIGLGQDNFVLSAVRKNENTEEYQAEWKEIKVLPNFTQGDADSVLTVTNEENVPKIEWKKPNYDWNNISNKPNLINTLAEQDSINTDNLSEELIEKIENSGLEVKTGTTDPGVLTTGELGQIYVNTTSNTGFVCVKANENEYIWQAIGSTINADGEVSDALIAAHNSDPTAHEDIRSSIDNSIMIDKSFGNGPDTVAEGDHTHGDLQLQIQSVEEVINADYYDNSNSVEFFTEVTPSHTLWSATSSSKVTGVNIIGGRYECTTSVAEQGLKTSNLTDLVDVVKGKTIVGVANLSSDNYTLYIKMHNGTSWSFGRIKSTDKIVTVKVPDNLTQFKLGLEYGGDGSTPDTCVMTNFALYLVNDVTITSTANIPNRNYTIWSWDDEEIINPEEFASFCNAYKINRVYQHVSTSVLDLETIRKFVGTMQKNRISVNWLTGDPLWALTEHHYHIAEQIQKVVSYNMSIQNDYEKIGTIQFDIEPHALDEWNADQASVIKQYQDAVVLMYKESLAKQLSLNVCVPSWFDSVSYDNEYGQGNLFDFVSKHSSSTVIMAYNTKSYVSIAEDEIRMGALNGKNVAVGLETHEITESITEDISFANKPIEDLYRAFETLFLVYKIYGVYKGYEFVIHDYGYFKAYTDKFNLIIPPNNILDKLTTENKTDLISAINEINTEVEQLKTKYPEGGGGGNCSCPTGTIEKDVTIEWNTSVTPTITFDITEFGYTAYKIFDAMPTKEQLLSANLSLSNYDGSAVYDLTVPETDILVENDAGIAWLLTAEPKLGYCIYYKTGETSFSYSGVDAIINVPETGIYQIWPTGGNLPTTMFGSMTYTMVEEVNFVQSDWNQNDTTKPDFIKNRPFFDTGLIEHTICEEQTHEFNRGTTLYNDIVDGFVYDDNTQYYATEKTGIFELELDKEYEVIWNEDRFLCTTFNTTVNGVSTIALGNSTYVGLQDTQEPFFIGYMASTNTVIFMTSSNSESYDVKVGASSPRIYISAPFFELVIGQSYNIDFDGTVYVCEARPYISNNDVVVLGNAQVITPEDMQDVDKPFGIYTDNNLLYGIVAYNNELSHTYRIYQTLELIHKIDPKFIGTDWNQNDENDTGYIKNRPFYETEPKLKEFLPETVGVFSFYRGEPYYTETMTATPEQCTLWNSNWEKMAVVWDGKSYECEPKILKGIKCIGNVELMMGGIDSGYPFILAILPASMTGAESDMLMSYSVYERLTTILHHDSYLFTLVDGQNYYSSPIDTLPLVEDGIYCIEWNGGEYISTAKSYTSDSGTSYIGLGNPNILGLSTGSSETFFIYNATMSNGTQSSAIVTILNNSTNIVEVLYTPDVTHKVSMSMFVKDIVTIDPKFIGSVEWDKINNKPFGDFAAGTVIYNKQTVDLNMPFVDSLYFTTATERKEFIAGASYNIEWDGVTYTLIAENIGNTPAIVYEGEDTFFGFATDYFSPNATTILGLQGSHTFSVTLAEKATKKIDLSYLPDNIGEVLPESTTSDNGKVLMVNSSGSAVWSTPIKELPIITTNTDEGKFLRVINGIATWSSIPNAEEASF